MSLLLPRRRLYTNVAALGKSSGGGDTAQALAFISRTSPTLTGSDATNYKTLINGLVNTNSTLSGTLFSRLDVLFILAAPDSANALLNLVNATFAASLISTPTFTTYRGFTGNGSSTGVNSNFNAVTATSPQWQQNSAHMSAWNLSSINDSQPLSALSGNGGETSIYPSFSGTDFYGRINDFAPGGAYTIGATNTGHLLTSRGSPASRDGYQNATHLGSISQTSATPSNSVLTPLVAGSSRQIAMFSSGASLSAPDITNFYNLLRTYMTAVGVP